MSEAPSSKLPQTAESVAFRSAEESVWWLRPFGTVRKSELTKTCALALTVFFLLAGYYILKTVREGLLLRSVPPETKVLLSAIQAGVLIPITWLYSRVAARVQRVSLVTIAAMFFIVNLAIFAACAGRGIDVGQPFFVWVGVFNVFVVSQFWTFANDVCTEEQGRRLFAVVGMGAALGSVLGPKIAKWLSPRIGAYGLMACAALILCAYLVAVRYVDRLERTAPEARASKASLSSESGFDLIRKSRFLIAIAIVVPLLNWVNLTGDYVLDKALVAAADVQALLDPIHAADIRERFIGDFRADFFSNVNILSLVLQTLVVGRAIQVFGVQRTIFVLPLLSLLGQVGMFTSMSLSVIAMVKLAENGVNYSLQNTTREALFLVTSRDAKYKAKPFIDAFTWRGGDVLAGLTIFYGSTRLSLSPKHFVALNAVLCVVWIAAAGVAAREYLKLKDISNARTDDP